MKVLSIIVPIASYSQNYERLLNWIVGCNDDRTEIIICYDDHGGEDSGFLVKLTGLNRANVIVLNGTFLSPGFARNAGIERARGEWIMFCDSDDSFNIQDWSDFLTLLLNQYSKSMLIFNFSVSNDNFSITQSYSRCNTWPVSFLRFAAIPGLWRVSFKRKELDSYRFSDSKLGEDIIFILRYLNSKPKIAFFPNEIYTYHVEVPGQLTRNVNATLAYLGVLKELEIKHKRMNLKSKVVQQVFIIRILKYSLMHEKMIASSKRLLIILSVQKILRYPFSSLFAFFSLMLFSNKLRFLLHA